jgi:hypothetical protein
MNLVVVGMAVGTAEPLAYPDRSTIKAILQCTL